MAWEDIAQIQGGAVSRQQLRDTGLSDRRVDRLVASSALHRQAPSVFVARGTPATYTRALWVAVLRHDGVLGFATGAHLWGAAERPGQIDVIVPPQRRAYPVGRERIHRIQLPDDAVTAIGGLPVTARTWTLLDWVGGHSVTDAVRLVDRYLQRGWLSLADIAVRLATQPGRTGNTVLRQTLAIARDGAAAESERRLHGLLRSAGIRGWHANYPLEVAGVVAAVLDIAFPERRLAIEVDGMAYHSDVDQFVRDRRRQNAIVGEGWTVLRFSWWDLTERPDYVVRTIRGQLGMLG